MAHPLAAHAAARFGLGARPGELEKIGKDPRAWVRRQIGGGRRPPGDFPASDVRIREAHAARDAGNKKEQQEAARALYHAEAGARLAHAVGSDEPFAERWVAFFSNLFAVSAHKGPMPGLVGAYEREAIRPNVWGRYADLVLAAELHPAMLLFLDNTRSTGPGSPAGLKRDLGLNENLAREILELHTLGVNGGYVQADVEALAKILTGFSIDAETTGRTAFVTRRHEPGAKGLLGRTYEAGEAAGRAALADLAVHPATARNVATRVARHFVADDPPQSVVTTLARVFAETQGDLTALANAVIDLDAAWAAPRDRLRAPIDWLVAAARAVGATDGEALRKGAERLGQGLWGPPSPAGWPDTTAAWAGPDALVERIALADRLAKPRAGAIDAQRLADEVLGDALSDRTRRALAAAADPRDRLALLLVCPEMSRR